MLVNVGEKPIGCLFPPYLSNKVCMYGTRPIWDAKTFHRVIQQILERLGEASVKCFVMFIFECYLQSFV